MAAFVAAVKLVAADVPGARPQPSSKTPHNEEREASRCGGAARVQTLQKGRSPDLRRGAGLDREGLSSSVEVLASPDAVRRVLAFSQSKAGIACFSRVLRRTLGSEQAGVRIAGVRLAKLSVGAPGGQTAGGVRIAASVEVGGAHVAVPLYLDALSFGYGPAEIDLFGTSFVQPVPERTEQQLLTLLRERARLHPL
jgi:hypothetical protein